MVLSLSRDGDTLYAHGITKGSKARLFKDGALVGISFVSYVNILKISDEKLKQYMQNKPRRLGSDVYTCEYKSAVAVCEACTIETEAQKAHALRLLCQRFTPNSMDGA